MCVSLCLPLLALCLRIGVHWCVLCVHWLCLHWFTLRHVSGICAYVAYDAYVCIYTCYIMYLIYTNVCVCVFVVYSVCVRAHVCVCVCVICMYMVGIKGLGPCAVNGDESPNCMTAEAA